jgi:hypothetical protein
MRRPRLADEGAHVDEARRENLPPQSTICASAASAVWGPRS